MDDTKRGISHWEQFQSLDANKDGLVSKQEFRDSMKKMNLNMSEAETRALMRKFSKNGENSIVYKDFCQFLSPKNNDLSYLERRLRTR